jgi:hypothetical protein
MANVDTSDLSQEETHFILLKNPLCFYQKVPWKWVFYY